ncbi:MAG TPA: diacylglycerol kinase family protein [Gemmatimonadales bacterium]|nr:diacylglycerol kinase family protein [Gemmatimonadales bacterium]
MSARVLLIANPAAARTDQAAETAVLDTLKSGGWTVELARTTGPGDARRLADLAVRDKLEAIAVLGGDGTAMQAAGGVVGTGIRLCVIPGGTGNLLAGNLRVPSDPVKAARVLLGGKARRIDLGCVNREDGDHYFAVACGAGYDAKVMGGTRPELKRRWGMAAYVATTFRLIPLLRRVPHRVEVDGVAIEVPATIALIANCREIIPPMVQLKRDVSFDDGLLDVFLLSGHGVFSSITAILHLLRERYTLDSEGGFVAHARGREIRIEAAHPEPVQLDGDLAGTTPLSATVVPRALDVCIP